MFKIYKLTDNTNGAVYIGKTKQKLYQRYNNHIQDFKRGSTCMSRDIIKNGNHSKLELIEETHDITRERYWIENTDCVNRIVPGRTRKEHYEDTKDKLDKVKLSQYSKEYRKRTNCDKNKSDWYRSMGGSPYKYNNSLLRISMDLFQSRI